MRVDRPKKGPIVGDVVESILPMEQFLGSRFLWTPLNQMDFGPGSRFILWTTQDQVDWWPSCHPVLRLECSGAEDRTVPGRLQRPACQEQITQSCWMLIGRCLSPDIIRGFWQQRRWWWGGLDTTVWPIGLWEP